MTTILGGEREKEERNYWEKRKTKKKGKEEKYAVEPPTLKKCKDKNGFEISTIKTTERREEGEKGEKGEQIQDQQPAQANPTFF